MAFDPTPEQLAILAHDPTRHARVLAGPGTGKSTTMVALLARLLAKDDSLRVRMLTFTRAATAELAEKVAGLSGQAERPSTIHSFAISVLLRNPGTGGFPDPLRIADTWEFKNIVRPTLAKRAGVGVRLLDRIVQEMASNWQSLTDEKDLEVSEADRTRFRGAWNEHRRILGYTLLQELPYALRRALHDHDDLDGIDFDLLLVDEYQDLNACDLEVLRLLSVKGGCENDLPDEQPEEGWGSWIIELSGKGNVVPAPTHEFRDLLLRLDKLEGAEQSLCRYLGQIEPLGKDLAQTQSDGVRIMTMGGSKGLTVRATIIAGVEDGLVPRPECDLSEERRILYVAMTRAKEYLFCTWARRRRGPTARAGDPSMDRRRHCQFLNEGPVESEDGGDFLNGRSSYSEG